MLNGAWLRHQAKAAIVSYLSPLTGGIGDEIDLAPSNPVASQTSGQKSQKTTRMAEGILYNVELLRAQKSLSDSIEQVKATLVDSYAVLEAIRPAGQLISTAKDMPASQAGDEKELEAPTFAKKGR